MGVMAMMSAWPACESEDPPASSDVDPGPTFGAEIALGVVGRGRVTSDPMGIDCPSSCFARVVLADPSVDGGDGGVTLSAIETAGAHFVGWTFAAVDLGVRGRGPAACSPMKRKSATPSPGSSFVIQVPFGETTGTPPRGHEEECAAFTTVPVAYAITATFEDDYVPPLPDADVPDGGLAPLFASPGSGSAKEIGVAGGYVYWRYEKNGLSGIASAFPGSSQVDVLVSPLDVITRFDVDVHVVFQHADGTLQAIESGNGFAVTLGNAPTCAALASDALNVYCRANGLNTSTLYSWPISGAASPTTVYVLPPGRDLAVDDQRFYFSDDKGGFTDQAVISSTPRTSGDGGVANITALMADQTSPRDLLVSSTYLFWLDDRGGGVSSARSGYKFTPNIAEPSASGSAIRFIAADRFSSSYWIGVTAQGFGGGSILRSFGLSSSTTPFRTGISGLGGIAVDSSYVYWTQSDGHVFRAPINDPGL
jgi:hypothetical protein